MGNQASETREEFILKIKPFEPNKFSELNGFLLKDHLKVQFEYKYLIAV